MLRSKKTINVGSPANLSAPLNRGLVAWWLSLSPMNTGSRLIDLINRNHATAINAPLWGACPGRPGRITTAPKFNGTSDYYLGTNTAAAQPAKPAAIPLSFAAWVCMDSLSVLGTIVSNDANGASTAARYGAHMYINATTGVLAAAFYDGGLASSGSTTRRTWNATGTVVGNVWYHVAAVINSATSFDLYINGITAGGSATGSGGAMAYSTFAPTIGANRDSTGGYTQFLNGKTDDVRIYNRAMSASEVLHLYAAGIAGYRNELNWTGPRLYAPSVAATFNPAWARNSNVFMGAGA